MSNREVPGAARSGESTHARELTGQELRHQGQKDLCLNSGPDSSWV